MDYKKLWDTLKEKLTRFYEIEYLEANMESYNDFKIVVETMNEMEAEANGERTSTDEADRQDTIDL
jgi:hypothetical protein